MCWYSTDTSWSGEIGDVWWGGSFPGASVVAPQAASTCTFSPAICYDESHAVASTAWRSPRISHSLSSWDQSLINSEDWCCVGRIGHKRGFRGSSKNLWTTSGKGMDDKSFVPLVKKNTCLRGLHRLPVIQRLESGRFCDTLRLKLQCENIQNINMLRNSWAFWLSVRLIDSCQFAVCRQQILHGIVDYYCWANTRTGLAF